MTKHTIIVTGGAGFIGSHLVDAYIKKGHTVIAVDDLTTGNCDFVNEKAILHEMDIRSAQMDALFDEYKPDCVSHHAAQIDVRKSVEDPLYDSEINIKGSLNLLELCVKHKVKKFIFASTGGAVYGSPETLPADENTPPKPECPYGASKLCVEQYVQLYGRMHGLAYTILRYPNVYGPRQSPHGEAGVCSILAGLMLAGETPTLYGNGEAFRDYVYVGDIAEAGILALSKGQNEIINLGSGEGVTVKRLFEIIAKLTGFKGKPILKPLRPGEVHGIYITGERAATVLGWQPATPLDKGLKLTVDYVKEQQKQDAEES